MIVYSEKINLQSIGINLDDPLISLPNKGVNLFLSKLEEKEAKLNNSTSFLNSSGIFKKLSDSVSKHYNFY